MFMNSKNELTYYTLFSIFGLSFVKSAHKLLPNVSLLKTTGMM